MAKKKAKAKPFLTDIKTLRDRARKHIATGGVTFTYKGDVKKAIDILQAVLATEIVCVLRYTMHAVAAQGISSEGVKAEFAQHAKEEQGHMNEVAERINQLGGVPDFNPDRLGVACGLRIRYRRQSGRDDQGKSDRGANCSGSLPRADPVFRRQGSGHAHHAGGHIGGRGRACERHARLARGARRPPNAWLAIERVSLYVLLVRPAHCR